MHYRASIRHVKAFNDNGVLSIRCDFPMEKIRGPRMLTIFFFFVFCQLHANIEIEVPEI